MTRLRLSYNDFADLVLDPTGKENRLFKQYFRLSLESAVVLKHNRRGHKLKFSGFLGMSEGRVQKIDQIMGELLEGYRLNKLKSRGVEPYYEYRKGDQILSDAPDLLQASTYRLRPYCRLSRRELKDLLADALGLADLEEYMKTKVEWFKHMPPITPFPHLNLPYAPTGLELPDYRGP
jgi:hypothetical protein